MLTPQQVLPFLEHPDRLVRVFATEYFSDCANPAPATAVDALRAYDRYPEGEFNPLVGLIADLPVTVEAVREILRRREKASGEDEQYALERGMYRLSMETAKTVAAEVALANFLPESLREHVRFQAQQLDHTPEQLWDKMLEMAEQQQKAYEDETDEEESGVAFSENMIDSVLKALALHPEFATPRVMAILEDASIEDYRELHAVTLAGMMKLEAAIPLLVHKLTIDTDVLRELAVDALTAIGTPEVVRQLQEMIPGKDWDVRLYADDPLERIKSVEAEEALLRLLEVEEAADLRLHLAQALCLQGSEKGFDRVRAMVTLEEADGEMMGLAELLYGLSVILGRDFPEAEAIRTEAERRQRERETASENFNPTEAIKRMAKVMGVALKPGDAEEILLDTLAGAEPYRAPAYEPVQPIRRTEAKVGRNDPCPCGSGKKYKKCCGG